ncbi:hypothetical protein [Hymenobacter negativus]|uniref:Uncharacterized protein n=1 Tax=Hymenobacter negativus TaxID=2795026 RepID=A0ABS3QG67_9BACT|nr:hypothetical protein [Hymenobacter negativus]MBO2010162.1 hypothetical protein [Hymenobacter negativus]
MNNEDLSSRELRDFVEKHDLRDSYSVVHFNSNVTITTAIADNKVMNRNVDVMITFNDYNSMGQVKLMQSDLDPYLYPTVFDAKWQKMEHVDGEYLLISDTHKQNAKIGKYSVKITPLKKLRD